MDKATAERIYTEYTRTTKIMDRLNYFMGGSIVASIIAILYCVAQVNG